MDCIYEINKVGSSLTLELFWYNVSGFYMIFYHIKLFPSITLYIYNSLLFSFQYYVTNFVFHQKQNV